MADIPISKIKINDDTLELKDSNARANVTAINSATTTNTNKIATLEQTAESHETSISSLNTKVQSLEEALNNSDNYTITVDSASETLIFSK